MNLPYTHNLRPLDIYMNEIKDKGIFKAKKDCFDLFNEVYFNRTPNQYSQTVSKFKDLFLGKLYTFNYNHPINEEKLEWFDRKPIILVVNSEYYKPTKHHLITGINLEFIPLEMRIFIIDKVFESFKRLIEEDLKKANGQITLVQPKQIFNPNIDFYGIIKYILGTVLKSNFEFAVRKYWWKKMTNIKNIPYEHWGFIPLIDAKMIVGKNIEEIHQLYWKSKHSKTKIKN